MRIKNTPTPDDHTIPSDILEIVRVELKDNVTLVHMSDGGSMPVANTIDEMELEFKQFSFLRIHPCHLINKRYIKSIDLETNLVATLTNGEMLPANNRLVAPSGFWKKWFKPLIRKKL